MSPADPDHRSLGAMTDIAVCMAAYNRRDRTLACLASLFAAELPDGARLTVYLLDDNSTDGTGEAVAGAYPQVKLLHGDGACYWAGGMRRAYGAALEGPHSHFVWLNDDVELSPDALAKLLRQSSQLRAQTGGEVIVVGAMMDPATGATTYSGLVSYSRIRPWKLKRRHPDPEQAVPCDTLNGNLVLIPRALALRLGNIAAQYTHAFGDIDYGYRARRAGASLWIAPGYAGSCAANVSRPRWKRAGLSMAQRFSMINSPLGVPVKDQLFYAFRHFGLAAPFVFVEPYVSVAAAHFWPERT
jgi:GT2 family glycosyltransferase